MPFPHSPLGERIVDVNWPPGNFLMVGKAPGGGALVKGSKDGTQWTTMAAPDDTPGGLTGAAYVKGNWFVTTFPGAVGNPGLAVGRIFRSRDSVRTWQQVYRNDDDGFLSDALGNQIAAGMPRDKPPGDAEKLPTVVAAVNAETAGLLYSRDLGATWRRVNVATSGDEITDAQFASFCNGLFFVGYQRRTFAGPASFGMLFSSDGVTWSDMAVFSEFSGLTSTGTFDQPNYMFFGTLQGVTWNGDKKNPKYVLAATGFWTLSNSAVAIATSANGVTWTKSGGPFGEWDEDIEVGSGAYEAYENDESSIAAGRFTVALTGDKVTRYCIPTVHFFGEVPEESPSTILSAEAGIFEAVNGGALRVFESGTVPSFGGDSDVIGVWPGVSAYSKKNGGTFLTVVYKGSDYTTFQASVKISQGSNGAWREVLSIGPNAGIQVVNAIGVGSIPDLERAP